jgi:catechol 2,3-dioxygenase-like lactoylglutathione lyase family enzyme
MLTMLAAVGRAGESIADHLVKPSLNVVITVKDMEAAKRFYGEVLGLEPMPPVQFSDKTAAVFFPHAVTMERFRVGTHEIKLIPGLETTEEHPGGVARGIGLRMVNYPIPDVAAFKKRLAEHGYPEPKIASLPGSTYRFGMLEDPDGNQVEFFFHEGDGPPGWQESLQIALTVSDVEASRHFYGEVLGLASQVLVVWPAVAQPRGPPPGRIRQPLPSVSHQERRRRTRVRQVAGRQDRLAAHRGGKHAGRHHVRGRPRRHHQRNVRYQSQRPLSPL